MINGIREYDENIILNNILGIFLKLLFLHKIFCVSGRECHKEILFK